MDKFNITKNINTINKLKKGELRANLGKKSFANPDELKEPEKTKASVVNFGSVADSKVILQHGWKCSDCIKPIVETKCWEAGHVGS